MRRPKGFFWLDLLTQQGCLKALREVMSTEMELEIRGRRFRSLERVIQLNEFGWIGLGSLTDRRKSVGTENGGGIGDRDIGA